MNGKGARSIEPQKSGAGEEDTFRNRAAASSPPAFHSEKLKPKPSKKLGAHPAGSAEGSALLSEGMQHLAGQVGEGERESSPEGSQIKIP